MSIAKPTRLQVEPDSLREDYGKFTIEPLEPGFGITIGHSLRRVLLSSIRGSAVFAVQIDGVTHEFSVIPGIVEDMVQVILNIKELQIEQFADEIVELELIGEGPCVIKAGDISTFEKAEILNPDLILATLQKGATVSMTMFSRFNKGYVTSEENQIDDNSKGVLPIIKDILNEENLEIVSNKDWLSKLSTSELVHLSSSTTLAQMLERDDFANRYKDGNPISLMEFFYPLFQGYDSVAVKADIEIGGHEINKKIIQELNCDYSVSYTHLTLPTNREV